MEYSNISSAGPSGAESGWIACHDCDALLADREILPGERLVCPRCGAQLRGRHKQALPRAAAFAVSAAVFYVLANLFPFLELKAGGQVSRIVLGQSVTALSDSGSPGLAAAVAVFILAAPLWMTCGMLYLLLPLLRGERLPGAAVLCRYVYGTDTWNMIEVFLLGVLVSLLKLGDIATVRLGLSFWAFAGLIFCLAASVSMMDRKELWDRLEGARGYE